MVLLTALGGNNELFLLQFRRNLALPWQDSAPFAARPAAKLMVFLFQCFPPHVTLLQHAALAFSALGGMVLRMAAWETKSREGNYELSSLSLEYLVKA